MLTDVNPENCLILASRSKIRYQLLAPLLSVHAKKLLAQPAELDEAAWKKSFKAESAPAEHVAMTLASLKAKKISDQQPDFLVVGSDQLLVLPALSVNQKNLSKNFFTNDSEIWLDKPKDKNDLRQQLLLLRGRQHKLVTAAVIYKNGAEIWRCLRQPSLTLRNFSEQVLTDYMLAGGTELLHSVGGMLWEKTATLLISEAIGKDLGDQHAILGLPILPLLQQLRLLNFLPK